VAELSPVEILTRQHDLSQFDCGSHESLNLWLKKYALQNQANESARTYVVHRASSVVGYYSISAGSVAKDSATLRAKQGLANHPVPIALLGRLAVHKSDQGIGLCSALLKDALIRIERAADILGIRAVLVHAIDQHARAFYERFDFEACPDDDLHLMLLMKDLRKQLGTIGQKAYNNFPAARSLISPRSATRKS
jgi:predicted N-acetyltransferase YhbS